MGFFPAFVDLVLASPAEPSIAGSSAAPVEKRL
jgi:hypothetical protein